MKNKQKLLSPHDLTTDRFKWLQPCNTLDILPCHSPQIVKALHQINFSQLLFFLAFNLLHSNVLFFLIESYGSQDRPNES